MKFLSGVLTKVSGSVGGLTFFQSKGGMTIRSRAQPINPNTPIQITRRAAFATLSSAWKALSQADRDSWIAAAPNFPYVNKLGQSAILTGQQLHQKLNLNLLMVGQAILTRAPVPGSFFTATLDSANFAVTIPTGTYTMSAAGTGDQELSAYATGPLSPGIERPPDSAFRFIQADGNDTASPIDIRAAYVAVHGTPVAGDVFFLRVYETITASGQKTLLGTLKVTVAA